MSGRILKFIGGLAAVMLSLSSPSSVSAEAPPAETPPPAVEVVMDSATPPPEPNPGGTGTVDPTTGELTPQPGAEQEESDDDLLTYRVSYICASQDTKATDQTNLCVVKGDGTSPRVLVQGGQLAAPVWSLDGRFIYFSRDSGAANLEVPGLTAVSIPHNWDIHYLAWNDGGYYKLADSPAPEIMIQDLPNNGQVLLSSRRFVNEASQLGQSKKKLEIKLKLIDFPCVYSMAENNCEIFGGASASDIAKSDCPPLALPLPLGISPFGRWATQSSLFCNGTAREPGFRVVDMETGASTKIFHKDLGACQVIDFNGGIAVDDDGSPVVIPFNTKSLKVGECRFYLSPARDRMAYINASGQVGVIDINTRQLEYLTVEASVAGINGLAWSPDGDNLLGFERTIGGPMYRISAQTPDDISFLGHGSQPSWSPIPLLSYTAEVVAGLPESTSLEGINKSQSASQAAAGCTLIR